MKTLNNKKITVTAVTRVDGEEQRHQTCQNGLYFFRDNIIIIQYDDALSGEQPVQLKTSIRIEGETVTLTRSGAYESRMIIKKGARNVCPYNTPYGTLMFGFTGKQIDQNFNQDGGRLHLIYEIDSEQKPFSENAITVTVKDV